MSRSSKDGLRIVHFSLQRDHIHLIVEAPHRTRLGRGMGGLASSFARKLNAILGRGGRVFGERHHQRDLATPREVRNALVYVDSAPRTRTRSRMDPRTRMGAPPPPRNVPSFRSR